MDLGRFPEAIAELTAAAAGSDAEAMAARVYLAEAMIFEGDLERARAELAVAVDALRAGDARPRLATAHGILARVASITDRYDEAREHLAAALRLHRAEGNRRGEAVILASLANHFGDEGRIDEARAVAERARRIHRELGARRSEGIVLGNLASILLEADAPEEVRALGAAALAIHRETGNARFAALVNLTLGLQAALEGQRSRARRQLEVARAGAETSGFQRMESQAVALLAALAADEGDLAAAEAGFAAARAALKGRAHRNVRAIVHVLGGFLDLARARVAASPAEAAAHLEAARGRLTTFDGHPLAPLAAHCAEIRVVQRLVRSVLETVTGGSARTGPRGEGGRGADAVSRAGPHGP